MFPLNNPVAVVTGGSRGIGRGIALALADAGHDLVVNYVSRRDAAQEVQKIAEEKGSACEIVQADISSLVDHQRIEEAARSAFGRVDLLVNNAGIAPRLRNDILEATPESFDEVLGTNLRGPYFLTQRFANWMLDLKRSGTVSCPRIVFVTSVSAYAASPNRGEYCISKTGLSMATQLFAVRLAEVGVPVFEVRPGIIETDMTAGVKEKYDKLLGEGLVPQGRWGTPDDVAKPIVAISRGDFDFSTGHVFEVGGGFEARRL